ncbi:MAG: hypothetical protein U1D31_00430 [Patescibacteria group bacterium]|nr:hypothetical protein [bacterium]MDZ4240587.1 hypothetical protein [Patescibacteria group bacterium]
MLFSTEEKDAIIRTLLIETRDRNLKWNVRGIFDRYFLAFYEDDVVLIGHSFWTGFYIQVQRISLRFGYSLSMEGGYLESSEEFIELWGEISNHTPPRWDEKLALFFNINARKMEDANEKR